MFYIKNFNRYRHAAQAVILADKNCPLNSVCIENVAFHRRAGKPATKFVWVAYVRLNGHFRTGTREGHNHEIKLPKGATFKQALEAVQSYFDKVNAGVVRA